MKNRDLLIQRLSDAKNVDEHTFLPGQYVPFDLALFYPGGMPL